MMSDHWRDLLAPALSLGFQRSLAPSADAPSLLASNEPELQRTARSEHARQPG